MIRPALIAFSLLTLLMLGACDMEKNQSLCAKMGMCPDEEGGADDEDDSKDDKAEEKADEKIHEQQ